MVIVGGCFHETKTNKNDSSQDSSQDTKNLTTHNTIPSPHRVKLRPLGFHIAFLKIGTIVYID